MHFIAIIFLSLLASCVTVSPFHHPDAFDCLLDEARQSGIADQELPVEGTTWWMVYVRSIGGEILLHFLALKQGIIKLITHEKFCSHAR